MRQDPRGFTVSELIIAIFLSGLVMSLIMSFTLSYWSYGTAAEADLDSYVERLNTADIIREYVGASSGLISQNSIADAHPESIDTSVNPNNYWTYIHAIPGTTSAPTSGSTPVVYFRRPSLNNAGTYIMNGSIPYEDEFIMYIDGASKELRLRTLANPNATGNRQVTSCAGIYVSASCPKDRVLVRNISSVATRYFSKSGTTIDYTSSTDVLTGLYNGPDFPSAEVVEFTVKLTYKPVFSSQTTSNETIVRIALRNT